MPKTPSSRSDRLNRRGCFVLIAVVLLALAAILYLSSQTDDGQRANEVMGGATGP